jgi:hypothetical protein
VRYLPVEVACRHRVVVGDAEEADAGGYKVQRAGASQSPRADDQG